MLFVQSAVVKQDKLQTLTRAASATPTNGNVASRRFFFNAVNDLSDHSVTPNDETPTEKKPDAAVSPYVVVHQGVLSRLTSWGQWKERYFVMDRVGIYWYRSAEAMQTAREQLLGGQGSSVFALQQLGLHVAWVVSLRLLRDPGAKNQMSLNSPTKIMKLRAPSAEAMEAWLTAFETLRESLMNELKAAPDVQKELLKEQANQAQTSPHRHTRSLSATSHFLGQSTMVVGNTAIVRTRAGTASSSRHGVKGATFVIGGASSDLSERGDISERISERRDISERGDISPRNNLQGDSSERAVVDHSMKKQSASESMLSKEGLTGQAALLEPRTNSSVSVSLLETAE